MRAQEQEGWVSKATIEHVADMLNMPYIRVLEVATFYTQFQLQPVGTKAHVQICGTTPCMLRGSEELIKLCKKKINAEPFKTNKDGTLSWEEVECQGACVNAPMVMVFKDTYEDLTPERLEKIIDAFEAGEKMAGNAENVTPGPQIDRIYSAPEGGLVTLTSEIKPVKSVAKAIEKEEVPAAPVGLVSEAPKAAAKPKKAAIKAEKPSLEDPNRPKAIEKPADVDDLKLISGVGPVLEKKLHELGVFTFAQVAEWQQKEIDWVDGYLSFKGRIERDNWIAQADALAKGGEEEYIRVFGKKPV